MNKYNYIKYSVFCFLLATLSVACIEKNDWEVEDEYSRLFGVSSLSVSPAEIEADVTWSASPNTEYYIIEVSKDSLYNEIEPGTTNGSILFGEDRSIKKSPYTLTGLESSSTYYIRIKGKSSTTESRWVYLETLTFNTKGEQILKAVGVSDKTDKSVTSDLSVL